MGESLEGGKSGGFYSGTWEDESVEMGGTRRIECLRVKSWLWVVVAQGLVDIVTASGGRCPECLRPFNPSGLGSYILPFNLFPSAR